MNTAENHSNTSRMGRPRKPESEKKLGKSVYLSLKKWDSLVQIDMNHSRAIDKLTDSDEDSPKWICISPDVMAILERIDTNASRAIEKLAAQGTANPILEKD